MLERGIILLDGVDEVPEVDDLRNQMLEAIDWLVKDLGEQARLIITSRPYVFERDNAYWLESFPCLELQAMQDHQVERFISNWYSLLRDARDYTPEAAQKEARYLFADLLDRSDLLDFARLPLMLTLLASLHFASGILPHSRAELFDKAVALMLERWTQRSRREKPDYPLEEFERRALKETESTRKQALQALALAAHDRKTLRITDAEIKGLFADHLSADCNPRNLLDFIRYRSGILRPGEGNNFEFYHRLFQAYLAALAITDKDNWQEEMDIRLRGEDRWWREVFLLLISAKVTGNSKPDVFSFLLAYYVPEVIDYPNHSEEEWHLLFLAAHAMVEQKKPLQGFQSRLYDKLNRLMVGHLQHLVDSEHQLPVVLRAEAGRLLGELGDPRLGVTVKKVSGLPVVRKRGGLQHSIPDIDWQEIPAGTFRMGTEGKEGYKPEKPAHDVSLQRFFVSRNPITNAQYRCFVDAGMYEDENFWQSKMPMGANVWLKGGGVDRVLFGDKYEGYYEWLLEDKERSCPKSWHERSWTIDNHPVVGVSWFEALAYSIWLNELLGEIKPDADITGMYIRLPTEAEWEFAARGRDARRYSWGNEMFPSLGNYSDAGIGRTSAVGLFPCKNAFSLNDMTGNVREWTTSRWGRILTESDRADFCYSQWDGRVWEWDLLEPVEFRVSRGGSYHYDADYVRCAFRNWGHPSDRSHDLGFRVVLGL